MHVYTQLHPHTHTHMPTYTHTRRTHTHAHTHTHTRIHTHTHAHTHTHTQRYAAFCWSKASERGEAALGCHPAEHPGEPAPAEARCVGGGCGGEGDGRILMYSGSAVSLSGTISK